MRRLLFVVTDPDRRGAQVFASELAGSLRQQGWHVTLVALDGGTRGGLDAEVLGKRRCSIATMRRLRRHIRHVDAVVGFGSTTLPMCSLSGLGLSTPFIYRSIGELRLWAPSGVRRLRTRLALRRAAAVVALWQAAHDVIIEEFRVGRERVFVIPRGVVVPPLPTPEQRAEARVALGLEEVPVALFLGALSEEKRPSLAVEAAARIPDLHLLVAGSGPLRSQTEQLAATLAPGRVHFLGQVADPATVLLAADVLVLTSRTEGLPGVLLEAAAVGVPAVATSVGAVPEIISHGTSGLLVPVDAPPDHIARQLAHVLTQSHDMGRRARSDFFPRFDLETVTVAWRVLLDDVIGRTPARID